MLAVCARLRVPTKIAQCAELVCEHHLGAHRVFEMRTGSVVNLLEAVSSGWRSPEAVEVFVRACEADKRGRAGLEDKPYPQADHIRQAWAVGRAVSAREFVEKGLTGEAVGQALKAARTRAIHEIHGPARKVVKPAPPKARVAGP